MQRIQKTLALCLLLLTSFGAFAQGGSGTRVSGRVLEEGTGVPVEFAVVVLTQVAVMVIAVEIVICFFVLNADEKADADLIKAFLFVFAVTVAFVAIMLFVTHRINKRTYRKHLTGGKATGKATGRRVSGVFPLMMFSVAKQQVLMAGLVLRASLSSTKP